MTVSGRGRRGDDHPGHVGGKGYEYLLKSVVVGDGDREMSSPLTRYYTESGCPPGTWVELIDTLIAELPEGAISKWDRAIRRPQRYGRWRRDQIAPLVIRATQMTGHVQSEAMELIRQFPALKAYEAQRAETA